MTDRIRLDPAAIERMIASAGLEDLRHGTPPAERERSLALAAALHATVVEHPTAGHGLVIEEPDWVSRVVLEFLARQEAAPR